MKTITTIKDFLSLEVEFLKRAVATEPGYLKRLGGFPNGTPYLSISDFIIQNGREFEWIYHPLNGTGEAKQCYRNAANLAFDDESLTYVEGYAVCDWDGERAILPVAHAWCINQEGDVIDPTWERGLEYFGVPFKTRFLRRSILRSEYWSLLGDFSAGATLSARRSNWEVPRFKVPVGNSNPPLVTSVSS